MTEPHDPFAVPDQPSGQQPPPPPPGYGPPPGYAPPPPGYGPPPAGWGPPPGGQPQWGPPPAQKTNALAIVGLVSIFLCTPAALVFGLIARSQIKRSGEAGGGMALASIIVGGISVAFFVLLMLIAISGFSASLEPG